MFEDGDFDGVEFSDYDLIHNAELEMDDTDRDWVEWTLFWVFALKIINRAWSHD